MRYSSQHSETFVPTTVLYTVVGVSSCPCAAAAPTAEYKIGLDKTRLMF